MTSQQSDLLKDPLFQLNALLWATQPLPKESTIRPFLYEKGFAVYAIAPLFGVPPDLRLLAQQESIKIQDGVRPDVVLAQEILRKFALCECKASSFGLESSTSEQARSLLLMTGSRTAEVLALTPEEVSESLLAFLIPQSDIEPLTNTITSLREELNNHKLSPGRVSFLGLLRTDNDVSVVIDSEGSKFFALPMGPIRFLIREPDTDPRPLYFIPYDPDVEQSEQERLLCRRILFERIQSTIIVAIGHADSPCKLVLESNKMLNDAMFGMYEHLENSNSKRHMRRLCREFMESLTAAVNSVVQGAISFEPGTGWKFSVLDEQCHQRILDALTRFSPDALKLQDQPQPSFFDQWEDTQQTSS